MKLTTLVASAALLMTSIAAQAEQLRVRGMITAIDGNEITVKNSADQEVNVVLTEPVILMYKNIKLTDLPEKAYIAVPSIKATDGNRRALGVIMFPEAMRGMNEGFKGWDLTPESKMTNATLAQIVSKGGENVLTVSYNDKEQTIYVPASAPVNSFAPAPDESLALGDNVVVFAHEVSGTITGKFIGMHETGGLPPL